MSDITDAREQVAEALGQLPALGIRADYALKLKRYPTEAAASHLSMAPNKRPSREPSTSLVIAAPKVQIYTGWAVEHSVGSGVIRAGDHIVTFPRTAVVEDFLNRRMVNPTVNSDWIYPEMELVVFELNGIDHMPVRWDPRTINLKVWIRRNGS